MPIRALLLLAAFFLPAAAEILSWQDVEFYDKSGESGKTNKRDGMLHLDRDAGVLVFTSENRVYATVTSDRISRVAYDDKNDRRLKVEYRDARDRSRTIEFKLKGGNRENILTALGSETNGKLERVTKE